MIIFQKQKESKRFRKFRCSSREISEAVTDLKTRQLDSSYAAAFYPWIQIRNTLGNNELVWIPPSIAALGALAKTDSVELWFAPAGFNRGGLDSLGGRSGPVVVQARQKLDSRDRDDLYKLTLTQLLLSLMKVW